jgi:hypothetical protein
MQCGRWETHVLAGTRVNWCARPSMLNNYVNWYLHLWHTVTQILPSFLPLVQFEYNVEAAIHLAHARPSSGRMIQYIHPSHVSVPITTYKNSSVSLQPSLQPRVSKPSILTQKWCAYWTLWEYMNDFFCVNKLRVVPYNNITHQSTINYIVVSSILHFLQLEWTPTREMMSDTSVESFGDGWLRHSVWRRRPGHTNLQIGWQANAWQLPCLVRTNTAGTYIAGEADRKPTCQNTSSPLTCSWRPWLS